MSASAIASPLAISQAAARTSAPPARFLAAALPLIACAWSLAWAWPSRADEPAPPAAPVPGSPGPASASAAADALAPLDPAAFTEREAAHLLRRAGFGGTLEEVAALHALGLEGAVDHLLGASDPEAAAFEVALQGYSRADLRDLPAAEREERIKMLRQQDQQQMQRLRAWWIERMVATRAPLHEKMVLFWHGHFCSDFRDVRNSYHLYLQNETLRRHALGSFRLLVHAIAKDPAMLEYLDNNRNRKGAPNENFARELMELFTLGTGEYTEHDIKEAARAFTGWSFEQSVYVKNTRQHDYGVKAVLGKTGRLDGEDVIEAILAKPAAARFVAGKLFRYFAHENPAPAVVEGLGDTLRQSNYELRPMLRQLFLSRAFYAETSVGTQIKGPVELAVGMCRSLGIQAPPQLLSRVTAALGQELFQPPNVKGWPGGRAWISTGTLFGRYNFAATLIGPVDPQVVREALAQRGGRRDRPGPGAPGAPPAAPGSVPPAPAVPLVPTERDGINGLDDLDGSMMEPGGPSMTPAAPTAPAAPAAPTPGPAPAAKPGTMEGAMEGEGDGGEGEGGRMEGAGTSPPAPAPAPIPAPAPESGAPRPGAAPTPPAAPDRRAQRDLRRAERARAREVRLYRAIVDVRARKLDTADAVLGHYERLLLAAPLAEGDRAVLRKLLDTDAEGRASPFSVRGRDAERRVEAMLEVLVNMPEFQLQ